MTTCPKCGSWRISGPTYDPGCGFGERLRYRCSQCGYSETTPTLDMAAVFSPCKTWRYRLERDVAAVGLVGFACLVNPSIAGEVINDQTVGKLIGFGQRNGIRRWLLGNLFAGISTDIKGLPKLSDPTGPDNDRHLREMMREADIHIVGWGSLNKLPQGLRSRWKDIVRMADEIGITLHCIGTNADGHPKHPLMTGYDVPITVWEVPWFPNRRVAA